MSVDQRAVSNWERATIAYDHYVQYIDGKGDRFRLSLIDLLYIKNFKGGSAVIAEPVSGLTAKLASYESALRAAHKEAAFYRPLGKIDDGEYQDIRRKIVEFVGLADLSTKPDTHIKGFGVSFCSALLHFFFPSSVPILDRRVVNGARIPGARIDTEGQITNLLDLYPSLIDHFRECLRTDSSLSVRSLDRFLFIRKIPKNPRKTVRLDDGK